MDNELNHTTMKHVRKIYMAPELGVYTVTTSSMLATSIPKASGEGSAGIEVQSKAFWGGSIFDDEGDDADIIDETY